MLLAVVKHSRQTCTHSDFETCRMLASQSAPTPVDVRRPSENAKLYSRHIDAWYKKAACLRLAERLEKASSESFIHLERLTL